MYTSHYSVLYREVLDFYQESLGGKLNGNYRFADLTFGGGGHTSLVLEKFPKSKLFATDQDPDALKNGRKIIKEKGYEDRLVLIDSNFENFPEWFENNQADEEKLDGILLDLGVSSHHFDEGGRGFSFRSDAPLDMRMNPRTGQSAYDVITSLDAEELQDILSSYGEERFSKRIALEIKDKASQGLLKTTKDLEDLVFHCYPKKLRHSGAHPATKTFQALRIYCNRELDVLAQVLPKLFPLLKIGGVLQVISFHSLEDRIVKKTFKNFLSEGLLAEILTKKPVVPTECEILENSRSRSAKLRVVKKVAVLKSKNKYPKSRE